MSEQTPTLGVRAVLDDQEFQQSYKRVEAALNNIEQHTKKMASTSQQSHAKAANAATSSTGSRITSLIRLRRQIMTFTFFIKMASAAVVQSYEFMAEGAENAASRMGGRAMAKEAEVNLGPLVRTIVDSTNAAMSAQEAFAVANAGILEDQGRFTDKYAELWEAARVAAVTGGGEAEDIFKSLVQSMQEGTGEAADGATKIFNLQAALQEYAASIGKTVDELTHGEAAQAQYNAIMGRTTELLDSGARAALDEVESYKQLSASYTDFKNVLSTVLQQTGLLNVFTKAMRTFTQEAVVLGTIVSTVVSSFARAGTPSGGMADLVQQWMGGGFEEELAKNRAKALEALGFFEDEVSPEERKYKATEFEEPNYEPIVKQLIKREELFEKHSENIEKINLKHQQKLEDIQLRYTNEVSRVERTALRNRERSIRAHALKVEDATIKHLSKVADMNAKYQLKLIQDTRKFQIDQIQNERLYQYERSLLVAEGDVLGIEDLDARYALEKQKDEENFTDKLLSGQETHSQKLSREEEQFKESMDQMIRHLEAQLEEINIREQDQLDDAELRRQQAREAAAQDLIQQLENEQSRHEKSLEQWNQYWTEVARQAKIGSAEVVAILEEFFGPTGEAEAILDDYMARHQLKEEYTSRVAGIVGPGGTTTSDLPWEETPVGKAYGDSGIVSSPTLFRAGESGPERYSFEPMTTIGASMSLSWQGGAIPVQGSGGMEGMDLSGVGDAIAQGLLIAIMGQMRRA